MITPKFSWTHRVTCRKSQIRSANSYTAAMQNEWQTDLPRLSPNEADKILELWLRQRLSGGEKTLLDSKSLGIRDLSQALGAREEDVLVLLAQIRGKRKARVRSAISVTRSWAMIAGIYLAAGALALVLYMWNRGFAEAPYYRASYVADWGQTRPIRRVIGVASMPRGLGFSYRGYNAPGESYRGDVVDWSVAERSLLDMIGRIRTEEATVYEPLVSPEEISAALTTQPSLLREFPPPRARRLREFGPRDTSEELPPENRLVQWHALSVNANGHEMRVALPSAKISNSSLDAAVRKEVKARVSGLIKALQAKIALEKSSQNERL